MLETLLQPGDKNERCGLLLRDGTIVDIENIAEDPTIGFKMHPAQLVAFIDTGEVVATWHTHPDTDPNLSGEDYAAFHAWPDLCHKIVGRRDGKVIVTTFKVENGLVVECD